MAEMYSTVKVLVEKMKSFCAYQERCLKEVEEKLYKLGADKDQANQVIEQLLAENFLREERYAKAIARGKFRMNQWGKIKITQQLKFDYISDKLITIALKEIDDQEYLDMITSLLQKKINTINGKIGPAEKHKIIQSVMQKGFEADLVIQCYDELKRSGAD